MSDSRVSIEIAANVTGAPAVDKLNDSLGQIGNAGAKAGTGGHAAADGLAHAGSAAASAGSGLDKAGTAAADSASAFDKMGSAALSINNIKTLVSALVTTLGGVPLEVLKTADSYNSLAARIKLVTGEGDAFKTAFEGVKAVAVATRSDLEATGELFSKIAAAGKDMGVSQERALQLTQTINQAIQVGGASAASSQAAITQLLQGLQSGVLRGDEFNSVMEQAPRLASAMAAGLNVGTGELRKMAEAGELTSTTVIRALKNQSETVAAEFAKLPPTVGGALTNLSTAWTVYIGEADKSTGASAAAATAINALGANLGPIGTLLWDCGKAAAALFALNMAKNFLGIGQAATTATAAISANTAATSAHTAATLADQAAFKSIAAGVAAQTAALGLNKAATGTNAAAMSDLGAKLAATSTRYGDNKTQLTALGTELAATTGKTVDAAAKTGALSGALGVMGGVASTAFGAAGKAVSGLVGLLGGIPGIAVMILANVKVIGTAMGEFVAKHTSWGTKLAENEAKLAALDAASKKRMEEKRAAQDELDKANDKAVEGSKKAQKQLTDFLPLMEQGVKTIEAESAAKVASIKLSGDEVGIMQAEADAAAEVAEAKRMQAAAVQNVLDATQAHIAAIAAQVDAQGNLSKAQKEEIKELEKLLPAMAQEVNQADAAAAAAKTEAAARAQVADAYQENTSAVGQYSDALQNAQAKLEVLQMSGVASAQQIADAQREVNAETGKFNNALKTLGVESGSALGGISDGFAKNLAALSNLTLALPRLKTEGVDTAQMVAVAMSKMIDGAKNEAELQKVKDKIGELRNDLGTKLADGLLDQAKDKAIDLKVALDAAKPGINSATEAMKALGITSDAELSRIADKSKTAFDRLSNSGTASARELSLGFKQAASDAIAAAGGIAPEWVRAEAAQHGYALAVDADGKESIKTIAELTAGVHRLGDAHKTAGDKAVEALEQQNAAQERANAATEKAIELENKRRGVDAAGFAADKDGKRIDMGGDLYSRTGIMGFLKSAGVDNDAVAQSIMKEFLDEKGNVQYLGNFGVKKYAGQYGTISQALLNAAEQYRFDTPQSQKQTPQSQQGTPAASTNASSKTYTVTLNINGVATPVNVASDADAQRLIGALQSAKLAA